MQQGLKSYTKQFTHEVSGVGTLSFNLNGAAKNMHIILPLISTVGENPINLSLIYNELDKDVASEFGNGFRLNYYKKLTYLTLPGLGLISNITNADGSVDNYNPAYNKETGCTLTYEQIVDSFYGYFLKDNQGNKIALSTTNVYPNQITNKAGEKLTINQVSSKIDNITNEYGDKIQFEYLGNSCNVKYIKNQVVLARTQLTIESNKLTRLKYYEGNDLLIKEIQILYGIDNIRLKNVINGNITKVVKSESNKYQVYDGYMDYDDSEDYLLNPHFQILYNTLNSSGVNKTTLSDIIGNKHYYFFKDSLPSKEMNQNGNATFYEYDINTKKQTKTQTVPIKDKNNSLFDLEVEIEGPVIGEQFIPLSNKLDQRIVDKLYYVNRQGSFVDTTSKVGQLGDEIEVTFYMASYVAETTGAVQVELQIGDQIPNIQTFSNLEVGELEPFTITGLSRGNYGEIKLKVTTLGTTPIRIGAFMMFINKSKQKNSYTDNVLTSSENEEGVVTKYEYGDFNNLEKVIVDDETIILATYNDNNKLRSATNINGTTTFYQYNEDNPNEVTTESVVNASKDLKIERRRENGYDSYGIRYLNEYDDFQKRTKYEYDSTGRIVKILDALNNTHQNTYTNGLLSALSVENLQNTYSYDKRKRLTTIQTPSGTVYNFTYDYKNQITQVTLDNVVILEYEYDDYGNIIKQQYGLNGDYYQFVYDSKLRIDKVYFNTSLKFSYVYDDVDGRLVMIKKHTSLENYSTKVFNYDENGKLIKIEDHMSNQSIETKEVMDEYNPNSLQKIHKIANKVIVNSYDDYSKSDKVDIISNDEVKTIGFSVSNVESVGQDVLGMFEIFPLHNNPDSLNGVKPSIYGLNDKKVSPFTYNADVRRYCFEPSKAKVRYRLGNSDTGTVACKVFMNSVRVGQKVIELVDTQNNRIALTFVGVEELGLTVNGTLLPNMSFQAPAGRWHSVALSYNQSENSSSEDEYHLRNYRLYVDGGMRTYSEETNKVFTEMYIDIGVNPTAGSIFNGHIEMLAFRNAYCENTTLSTLMNQLIITSTKTSVDEFNRISKKEIHRGIRDSLVNTYEYYQLLDSTPVQHDPYEENIPEEDSIYSLATYRVKKEVIKGENNEITTRTYTYDDLGRVVYILDPTFGNKTYAYDERGFLVNDNGKTITYDDNGNILTYNLSTYTYDTFIKDRLKKLGTETYNYDPNNPLLPLTTTKKQFVFEGRRLKSIEDIFGLYEYEYNEQGMRIRKSVDGEVTSYYYDGDRLITEISPTYRLDFLYDDQGMLFGLVLNNATKYFYIRDILQNILGIVDENGNVVVKYDYNAFGKKMSITDTSNISIGIKNPFRYKGYYYDEETGLFWLSSRYYSPELCRFISPDSVDYLEPESINGLNLYAYAKNNPIMYYDPSGHSAILVIGLLVGSFIVGAGASVVSQGLTYGWDEINYWQAGVDGLFALGSTALAMTGIGALASAGIGAVAGWSQYAIGSAFHGEDLTLLGSITAAGLGFIGGAISGAGARNSSNIASNMRLTGKGASAVKAITTASNRYLAGEISMKGLQATARLWGNVALNAVQDAIAPTIRHLMIKGALTIAGVTIGTAAVNCGLYYAY